MSLDKAIEHGKEHRKPYTGAKAVSSRCRNGYCSWCNNNKFYRNRKQEEEVKSREKEYSDYGL